jgi:predicted nucleotidyltransferase
MLDKLFSSKIRAILLRNFFTSPGKEFSARELSDSFKENYSSIWKELVNLNEMGILKSEKQRGIKLYALDESCPFMIDLKNIVEKTEGIPGRIQKALNPLPGIHASFIYGSYVSGKYDNRSDIDLMIIGIVEITELSKRISKIEKEISRPINYIIYSEKEWKEKKTEGIPFIKNVVDSEKVFLIGGENDLR